MEGDAGWRQEAAVSSEFSSSLDADRAFGARCAREGEKVDGGSPRWQSSRRTRRTRFLSRQREDSFDGCEDEDEEPADMGDDEVTEEVDLPSASRVRHVRQGSNLYDEDDSGDADEDLGEQEADNLSDEVDGELPDEGYKKASHRPRAETHRRRSRDPQVMSTPRHAAASPPLRDDGEDEMDEDGGERGHRQAQRRGRSQSRGRSVDEEGIRGGRAELWPGANLPAFIYSPTTAPTRDMPHGEEAQEPRQSRSQRRASEKQAQSRSHSAAAAASSSPSATKTLDLDDVDWDVADGHHVRMEAYFEEDLTRRRREHAQRSHLERLQQQRQRQQEADDGGPARRPPPAGLTWMADPFAFTESVLLNYGEAAHTWDGGACDAACKGQPVVCLCSSLCCLTVPFFLVQERRTLLLHTVRSRYVCCIGAVPCCWPPAALWPELYLAYVAPSDAEEARDQAGREAQRFRDGIKDINTPYRPSRKNKYPPVDENGQAVMPPVVSVMGVSAVGSVLNVVNGLPQYGGYNSVQQPRGDRRGGGVRDGMASKTASCCGGCCTFTPDTNTCTLDCRQGGCVYCRHPTACCLTGGCPICCLVTEACCCMPCAALGNRVFIRRHYGFAPDRVIDDSVACLYSCCLTCLTGKNLAKRREAYAAGALSHERASCWQTFARSVAACAAATCCLWPCLCCSVAQQRDAMERRGYPQLSAFRPSDITGMV